MSSKMRETKPKITKLETMIYFVVPFLGSKKIFSFSYWHDFNIKLYIFISITEMSLERKYWDKFTKVTKGYKKGTFQFNDFLIDLCMLFCQFPPNQLIKSLDRSNHKKIVHKLFPFLLRKMWGSPLLPIYNNFITIFTYFSECFTIFKL